MQSRSHSSPKQQRTGTTKLLKLLIFLVLLLFCAGVWLVQRNRSKARLGSISQANLKSNPALSVMPATLSIREIAIDWKTRKLKGILENPTGTSYKSIVISFKILSPSDSLLDVVEASVAGLEPKQNAKFETSPLPSGAAAFAVREILGMPR